MTSQELEQLRDDINSLPLGRAKQLTKDLEFDVLSLVGDAPTEPVSQSFVDTVKATIDALSDDDQEALGILLTDTIPLVFFIGGKPGKRPKGSPQ